MSKRVETNRTASMGEEFENDPMFNAETEAGMASSLNNANVTIGPLTCEAPETRLNKYYN